MDINEEAAFCAEFQQLGQIVEESHGFSFTNTTVPLSGEQSYANITCIEFDQKENLIWIANDQGHATSFYRADLTLYTKFWWSLDKNDLIPNNIITTDAYVIFIGSFHIALFTRGGALVLRYKPELIKTINCGHWSPNSSRFLYFGGEENIIGIFELNTCKEIKGIETDDDCCLIRSTDRFIVTANKNGQITVRNKDFSQYKVVAKVVAHNAGIEDLDVFGNYLICCGKSTRQNGSQQGDNFMKVYDVRNLASQTPIGFNRPPKRVKFVHGLDGVICASTGFCLFMVDILNNKTSTFVNFSLPSDDMAISNSGQAIAASINNYTSYLQIFCNSIDPAFSLFDMDSIFPFQNEEPFVPFDDKTSLAVFPVAYTPTYCSDKWTTDISSPHYLHPAAQQDQDQTNTKDVRYYKKNVNNLVSGFNVWCFDEKANRPLKVLNEEDKKPNITVAQEEDTQNNVQKVNSASPSINNNNKSIMHRFQNASEFVPGRQLHDANNLGNKTPEIPAKSTSSSPVPTKASTPPRARKSERLQNMSFEQFRKLAEETKKQQEQ